MSELDLCVILGNLFDNAIDANLPLPQKQRMIRVYMVMKNTQLYISFTNFFSNSNNKSIPYLVSKILLKTSTSSHLFSKKDDQLFIVDRLITNHPFSHKVHYLQQPFQLKN